MRIQFLKSAMTWQAGDIAEVSEADGQWLVNVGKATTNVVETAPLVFPVAEPAVEPEEIVIVKFEPEPEQEDEPEDEPEQPFQFARAGRSKRGRSAGL